MLQAALALHDKVALTFRKTATNFHYEFTVRHLAQVVGGIRQVLVLSATNPVPLRRPKDVLVLIDCALTMAPMTGWPCALPNAQPAGSTVAA